MEIYTGIEFFADYLGIPEQNFRIAHSFYSGDGVSKIYPDHWATGAATGNINGISNWSDTFNSGVLSFNGGNELISFSNGYLANSDLSLNDATIFISFEKTGFKDNILFSSMQGSAPFISGICVGVNSANKLYLKYWDNVDYNPRTLLYTGILSNKNLICISKNASVLSMGRFDSNTFDFKFQEFTIYENSLIESDHLYLGGYYSSVVGLPSKTDHGWAYENTENFMGYVDKFYYIYSMPSFYNNDIGKSLCLNPTGQLGYYDTGCYTTGNLVDSGFFTTGVTGIYSSGYIDISTGTTGYRELKSGWAEWGFTGYYDQVVGNYFDSCGKSHDVISTFSGFGYITGYDVIKLPLTGYIYTTGYLDIDLTGYIWNNTGVWVTGEICDDVFIPTGDMQFKVDQTYIDSLSYKDITIVSNKENILLSGRMDVFFEDSQYKTLGHNKIPNYINDNVYTIDF
jgi:hypothetical protein